MSGRLVGWVLDHATVKGPQMLVLIDLAERAQDAKPEAWSSVQTIAVRTNLSERSVTTALQELEKAAWIQRVGVTAQGARRWRLALPDVPKKQTRAQKRASGHVSHPPEGAAPGAIEGGTPLKELHHPPEGAAPKPEREPDGNQKESPTYLDDQAAASEPTAGRQALPEHLEQLRSRGVSSPARFIDLDPLVVQRILSDYDDDPDAGPGALDHRLKEARAGRGYKRPAGPPDPFDGLSPEARARLERVQARMHRAQLGPTPPPTPLLLAS